MGWVKRLADHVIQRLKGEDGLEFAWSEQRPAEPAEQAKTTDLYVRAVVYTINEARAALGLDPVPGDAAARIYGNATAPLATAAARAVKRRRAVESLCKACAGR